MHTLMAEHRILLDFAEELGLTAAAIKRIGRADACGKELEHIDHILEHFRESEKHYLREENALFPVMERRGITGPTAQMWAEHNEIRGVKKRLYGLAEGARGGDLRASAGGLEKTARELEAMLQSHFEKEDTVLFPMALQVISGEEWAEVERAFDEVGYCCFTPERRKKGAAEAERGGGKDVAGRGAGGAGAGAIELRTGRLTREELESMLNNLPVDITFVGADNTVRYYSDGAHRIFPRTVAIIGRAVQNCHPQKSVHIVQKILDEFRAGKRDVAEFWINLGGRVVHIRYFAIRRDGEFLGTLEVSQDITEIKKIKGEKRLLDWGQPL
ncbi:MAG: DUF438 domain-containing protein [Thermoplasmatota archaeon]